MRGCGEKSRRKLGRRHTWRKNRIGIFSSLTISLIFSLNIDGEDSLDEEKKPEIITNINFC